MSAGGLGQLTTILLIVSAVLYVIAPEIVGWITRLQLRRLARVRLGLRRDGWLQRYRLRRIARRRLGLTGKAAASPWQARLSDPGPHRFRSSHQ